MHIDLNQKNLSNYAKSLRKQLVAKGLDLKHTEVIEMLSQMVGHRNANSLVARIKSEQPVYVAPTGELPEDRIGAMAFYRQRKDSDLFEVGIRHLQHGKVRLIPSRQASNQQDAIRKAQQLA